MTAGAVVFYIFAAITVGSAAVVVLARSLIYSAFALLFTFWALDMLDRRRPILFSIFFVLALGCREDVPIGFMIVGAFLLLTGKHTRAAIAMTAFALVYLLGLGFLADEAWRWRRAAS